MQTVEDVVDLIAEQFATRGGASAFGGLLGDDQERQFIRSLKQHLERGSEISVRQAGHVLEVLARVRGPLVGAGLASTEEIERLLAAPRYRRALHVGPAVPREVVHLGDNCLGFRFPWDPALVERIKGLHQVGSASLPVFDCEHGIWIVPVDRHTLEPLVRLIGEARFLYDETVVAFLEACAAARDQPSTFGHDPATGMVHATIRDNELLAAWAQHVARGGRR